MICEIWRKMRSKFSNSACNTHTLHYGVHMTGHLDISPFSSSRSWPSCPLCNLVFPLQWKPGRWGTFQDRAHREDHSWQEKKHASCACTTCSLYWSVVKLCPWRELTSSKPLSGSWTSPLTRPASAACQSMLLSKRKGGQEHNWCQLQTREGAKTFSTRRSPAWKPWARSFWDGRQSCDWEKMLSQARRCNCGDSDRCQPPPPISLWLLLEWPHPHSAESLWQWGCLPGRGKRRKNGLPSVFILTVRIWEAG